MTYVLIGDLHPALRADVLRRRHELGLRSTSGRSGSGRRSDGELRSASREGEYWRLVTGGFLHDPSNLLHILFNMYILYWLGTMLEPVLGHVRFVALYFASLLAGSFGALVADAARR